MEQKKKSIVRSIKRSLDLGFASLSSSLFPYPRKLPVISLKMQMGRVEKQIEALSVLVQLRTRLQKLETRSNSDKELAKLRHAKFQRGKKQGALTTQKIA